MTGDECAELAALWNAPTIASEQREVEMLALRTPRRARMVQAAELGSVGIIAAAILGAMLWRFGVASSLIGTLLLLILGWSAWNRHRLVDLALLTEVSNRQLFVAKLVAAKEAELRRSAMGLALILPCTILATMFAFLAQVPADRVSLAAFIPGVILTARGMSACAFLGIAVVVSSLSHLRLVGELARLRTLSREYDVKTRGDVLR